MKSIFIFTILSLTLCLSTALSCGTNAEFIPGKKDKKDRCTCNIGYYGSEEEANSTGCKMCPDNTSSYGAFYGGVETCCLCKKGFYLTGASTTEKEAVCTQCPNNTSSTSITTGGVEVCSECREAFYNAAEDKKKQLQCVQCPDNTTSVKGQVYNYRSNGIEGCGGCISGYYIFPEQIGGVKKCTKCPKNSNHFHPYMHAFTINDCKCDDQYAYIDQKNKQCACMNGYEGLASVESPCKKKIEQQQSQDANNNSNNNNNNNDDKSSQNIIKMSFCLILLILSI